MLVCFALGNEGFFFIQGERVQKQIQGRIQKQICILHNCEQGAGRSEGIVIESETDFKTDFTE